jgi:hypothetical protein
MISNLADESLPGNGQMSELGLIFRLGRAKLRSPLYPQEQTSPAGPVGSEKCQEGTFGQAAFLHFRTDRNANCAGPRLAARDGIASKSAGRPSRRFPCPGGPCSTSFACNVQPAGPGIQ